MIWEWWASIGFARTALRVPLPLTDQEARSFSFSRTDSVDRLLHHLDRAAGTQLETADPQLANSHARDRYLLRSLAEEAITSSQLEGASTTRRVAKEMLLSGRAPRTRDERMIANNFAAMEYLRHRKSSPLSLDLILELHRMLTEDTLDSPENPGRLRRMDETVLVQDRADGVVLHIPPRADQLEARLSDMIPFANSESEDPFIHPMIRAITLHFGLAYEHPFVDGNGRTARALFYWSLLRSGYWLTEFLSISRVIQKAPAQYSRAFLLTETDNADLTYFLIHQLEVVRHAIDDLFSYLRTKSKQLQSLDRHLKEGSPWNHRQRTLLAHALRHPRTTYTVAEHQRDQGVVYETARSDLQGLEAAGLLLRQQRGKKFVFTPARRRAGHPPPYAPLSCGEPVPRVVRAAGRRLLPPGAPVRQNDLMTHENKKTQQYFINLFSTQRITTHPLGHLPLADSPKSPEGDSRAHCHQRALLNL